MPPTFPLTSSSALTRRKLIEIRLANEDCTSAQKGLSRLCRTRGRVRKRRTTRSSGDEALYIDVVCDREWDCAERQVRICCLQLFRSSQCFDERRSADSDVILAGCRDPFIDCLNHSSRALLLRAIEREQCCHSERQMTHATLVTGVATEAPATPIASSWAATRSTAASLCGAAMTCTPNGNSPR